MNTPLVLAMLGWCMVINFGLLFFWFLMWKLAPDLTYRTQRIVTSISREEFDGTMYRLMGQFKLAVILFNLSPYLALRIVT